MLEYWNAGMAEFRGREEGEKTEVGGRKSDVGKKEEGGLDPCLTFQRANKGLLSVLEELETLEEEFPDVDEGLGPLDPVEI